MLDLATSAIRTLLPYLPAVARAAVATDNELAAKALYGMIGIAFEGIGRRADWEAYVANPVDTAVVERLLAMALDSRPHLADDIESVVKVMTNDGSYSKTDQSNAYSKGDMVGRDKNTTTNRYGGMIAVVAVVIVAVVAIAGGRAVYKKIKSAGLTADSTCAEFLQASQTDELAAIRRIGLDEGVAGVGSPLALPAISYSCSGQPTKRLGDVIAEFKGQF